MVTGLVFCGAQGCSEAAIGQFIVTIWERGTKEAIEKAMPVCEGCRNLAEETALAMQAALPAHMKLESRWTDDI